MSIKGAAWAGVTATLPRTAKERIAKALRAGMIAPATLARLDIRM
jgi:hypothetical protein